MFHNCKMLAIILYNAPMPPSSFLFFSAFIVLQQRTPFLVHRTPLFEHTTPNSLHYLNSMECFSKLSSQRGPNGPVR